MKKKRGQPSKKPGDRKSVTTSIRMTPPNEKKIIKKYGSIQVFFDRCIELDLTRHSSEELKD